MTDPTQASSPAVSTRRATPSDVPAVAALFDAYRQFYGQPPDLPLATRFIDERLRRDESVIWVAQEVAHGVGQDAPGKLVGFCQMYPSFCSVVAQPIFVLYDFFVAPQSRRTRAGRQLLLAAEQHCRSVGAVRMDLTTAKTNHAAQALYESLGWVRDEIFFAYSRTLNPVDPVNPQPRQ